MTLADFLTGLDSAPLLGEQEAVLKALQEARGGRPQLQQQPSLEEKLAALSNMSLSNGSKVSAAAGRGYTAGRPRASEVRTQFPLAPASARGGAARTWCTLAASPLTSIGS